MNGRSCFGKKIIICEAIAFLFIILFIWLDEVIDIPHLLLGAEATPLNWKESLIESVIAAIVGMVIIGYTQDSFKKSRFLRGYCPSALHAKELETARGTGIRWKHTFVTDQRRNSLTVYVRTAGRSSMPNSRGTGSDIRNQPVKVIL